MSAVCFIQRLVNDKWPIIERVSAYIVLQGNILSSAYSVPWSIPAIELWQVTSVESERALHVPFINYFDRKGLFATRPPSQVKGVCRQSWIKSQKVLNPPQEWFPCPLRYPLEIFVSKKPCSLKLLICQDILTKVLVLKDLDRCVIGNTRVK